MKNWLINNFWEATSTRKDFWLRILKLMGVILLSAIIVLTTLSFLQTIHLDIPELMAAAGYYTGMGVSLLLPLLCITRLNDLNKTKWLFILGYIPYLNLALLAYCGFFPSSKQQV